MSDIKKLQKIFGKKAFVRATDEEDSEHYTWYRTSEGEEIGIDLDTLSSDSEKLLDVFLTPLSKRPIQEDERQLAWYEMLYNNRTPDSNHNFESGRFLHFSIRSQDVEHDLFVEAFQNLLSEKVIPVWKDRYTGVFMEPASETYASIDQLVELLDSIESDFYMKSTLFIGSTFTNITEAKQQFDKESTFYKFAADHPQSKRIHTLSSVFPLVLLHQSQKEDTRYIYEKILSHVEPELLKTVKTLLDCNLNHTLAAKKRFIHRNSLQYRMEKFADLTGLDPKVFEDAVTIHLLLSMEE
ncbi:PucR family transcriptional regulator [Pseudalkalibacillus salsuginis]|uniref:PucR family transcriptional regulator n=1 Tax=Pseudalkalibacillus salsuginis TaxID=2910972 RepID=UPI001F2F205B|nr:helix-turn-helix domain-containing protein [Pseudalkalibacillus salsuginis]MCF6411010.1 helix-turn-helix domain-containing protein [Pseudalkalibacillus salsuginis]